MISNINEVTASQQRVLEYNEMAEIADFGCVADVVAEFIGTRPADPNSNGLSPNLRSTGPQGGSYARRHAGTHEKSGDRKAVENFLTKRHRTAFRPES
jgi:hypothetical protein